MGSGGRRESYISQQFGAIDRQLQTLFDEIGLTSEQRELSERDLYAVVSEALDSHVERIRKQRDGIIDQCHELQQELRTMANALRDFTPDVSVRQGMDIEIKPPFQATLRTVTTAHSSVEKEFSARLTLVNERLAELKELGEKVDGLQVPSNVLPVDADHKKLDLSQSRLRELEHEISTWRREYQDRVSKAGQLAKTIVSLWAELAMPETEIDQNIMTHHRTDPSRLGTLNADLDRLNSMVDSLQRERDLRESQLAGYKKEADYLWTRLGESSAYVERFEMENRGLGERVLSAYEMELERLREQKKACLPAFIQHSREVLRDLWDKLYFTEAETLVFSPAWSDAYTEATLEAHEAEIARLEALLEERRPLLNLIGQYRGLQKDKADLEASMADPTRLMGRGVPGRLLKEEQMRKRLAKRMPAVLTELRDSLVAWRDAHQRPFEVEGKDFLETIEEELEKAAPPKSVRRGAPAGASTSGPIPSASRSAVKPPAFSTAGIRKPPLQRPLGAPRPGVRHAAGEAAVGSQPPYRHQQHQQASRRDAPSRRINNMRRDEQPIAERLPPRQSPTRLGRPPVPQRLAGPVRPPSPHKSQLPRPGSPNKAREPLQTENKIHGGHTKSMMDRPGLGMRGPRTVGAPLGASLLNRYGPSETPVRRPVEPVSTIGKQGRPAAAPAPQLEPRPAVNTVSENWATYCDSSDDDLTLDTQYAKWRAGQVEKLAQSPAKEREYVRHADGRISEFNWDKDAF